MRLCPKCSELFPDDGSYCPVDGASLVFVTDPLVGKTIAQRYRVIQRLGGGGMSSVYLARHVMIERLSAVKVLRGDLSSSAAQRDRFLREARAVNRINHENIVEITDYGEWDDLVYLVMEYIPGEPLSMHLAAGPLPWQRAAVVGVQIAAALGRAHQMGVVHRDLKPGNVLLLPKAHGDVAMLTDFGIAKILDAPSLTLTSQIFGTPGYIAPEYIEGGVPDTRSDLYSLGVVLYESLSGRLPHDDRGSAPIMLQVLRDPPRPLAAHVSVPEGLERLVMELLARRPNERPRDAFDVVDCLSGLLASAGLSRAGALPLAVQSEAPRDDDPSAPTSRPFAHLAPLSAAALARVEAAAATHGTLPGDAITLLAAARSLARDVALASHAVSVDQGRVLELERHGRTLRQSIGRAIDDLARELSRTRARRDALGRRREELGRACPAGEPPWELAALVEEDGQAAALERDLELEIGSLRDHLRDKSAALEAKLDAARGSLEGRVAALRRVAAEAEIAIEEASRALGGGELAGHTVSLRTFPGITS